MMDPLSNRRYLTRFDTTRMGQVLCDVLVIGGGVAGMRAALAASNAQSDVVVICKGAVKQSNTNWAQGGVAVVLAPDDTPDKHIDDTMTVGCGLCDQAAVEQLVRHGPAVVLELAEWGCPFDRAGPDEYLNGGHAAGPPGAEIVLALGREGGHSANRIVHALGDATGKAMAETLTARVRSTTGIRLFEQCFVIDLLTDRDGACVGAVTFHAKYGHQVVWASQTILASGGCGHVYRETTNPDVATGDGHAMAYRAGCTLRDMEFMQFHPTTLYVAGASRVLISEAVRGEGGKLVRKDASRFMPQYHPMAELAPRDVVSRAIIADIAATGATSAYLDVRHFPPGHFAQRFPAITRLLAKFDIDPQKQLIPVRPAAHYMIGGVKTDLIGRTGVPGLFAVGECASTGVHGANRLASNSLLEGLVFGLLAGTEAARLANRAGELRPARIRSDVPPSERTELDIADVRSSLRSVTWRNLGIERSAGRLEETIEIVDFWNRYVFDKVFENPAEWELQNMLTMARLIAQAALQRRETRGTHFRSDFPQRDDEQWGRHIDLRRSLG